VDTIYRIYRGAGRRLHRVLARFGGLNESRVDGAPADDAYLQHYVARGLETATGGAAIWTDQTPLMTF
jgi:hypothetical protein